MNILLFVTTLTYTSLISLNILWYLRYFNIIYWFHRFFNTISISILILNLINYIHYDCELDGESDKLLTAITWIRSRVHFVKYYFCMILWKLYRRVFVKMKTKFIVSACTINKIIFVKIGYKSMNQRYFIFNFTCTRNDEYKVCICSNTQLLIPMYVYKYYFFLLVIFKFQQTG